MVKSRSRSPRWRPGPAAHEGPEYNRHRQDYDHNNHGFHRNSRRAPQWDNERPRRNNSRSDAYSRFNDDTHERGLTGSEFKRSPFHATNHRRRTHSPERPVEGSRRFSEKYHEVADYGEERNRNFHDHRLHEKNIHNNNNTHINDYNVGRRWGNFYRPQNRDRDWHENDHGHWNEYNHTDQHLSPRRRPEEFEERKSFQKRYPEDDYREYEQPYKRVRDAGRHDYQPPQRNSHWRNDHPEEPYYSKNWTPEDDHKHSNTIIHEKQSGHVTKIEYDYSHRSPSYVHTESIFSDDHINRPSRHEERKLTYTQTYQNYKTDGHGQERKYNERSLEPLSKGNSRDDGSNGVKHDTDMKHQNHKLKEKNKEERWRRKEDECRKEPTSTRHLRPQTADTKVALKIAPEKEAIDPFGLKKSTDKYRPPHEHKNKDLPLKSEATKGQGISEGKLFSADDLKKRNEPTSKDRQTSQDLAVLSKKERFHSVFEHLQQSMPGDTNTPRTEFTQQIVTIIHEVKASHFKSSGMSLHERFSKMQTESNNKQELNLDKSTFQTNPEIHRRIDISLEELKNKSLHKTNKSLHKTVEVQSVSLKTVGDPNDLRHDIERRRIKRLHSNPNGTSKHSYGSDVSGSYYRPRNQEDEEFHSSCRERRTTFQESKEQLPVPGSRYRGSSNQYYTSQSKFEDRHETRRPPKGWGNPAARI